MTIFNKQNSVIIATLIISLLVRIYLSQFDGYKNDMFDFKLWSQGVYNIGITNFYRSVSSDYPPFYIYILWIVGAIYKLLSPSFDTGATLFTILIKLPANIADIFTALLIFKILRKYTDFKTAYFGMVIYTFNPAIIYNSAIWGQVDSINTFFMLFAIMLMISDRLELAGISLAVAILTKPQSMVVLPFIAILMIKDLIDKNRGSLKFALLRFTKIFMVSIFAFLILALPFYTKTIHGLIIGLVKIYTSGYDQYAFNSVNAFNFWALLGLMRPDNIVILSLSYKTWGYVLFGLLFAYLIICIVVKDKDGDRKGIKDKDGDRKGNKDKDGDRKGNKDKDGDRKGNKNENKRDILIYFAGAILLFGFFMFFTRIHERYLFSMFAPLVIVTSLDRRLKYVYWILTFTFLFNLYSVLQAFNNGISIPYEYVLTVSIINLGVFIYMLCCFSKSSGGKLMKYLDTRRYLEQLGQSKRLSFKLLSFRHVYIISIMLFVILAVLSPFSGSIGLIYGIIFTLFLPGFIVVNLFLKEFGRIEKLVLTIFLSVVLSTQLVYWLSIAMGYSKFSIVVAGLLLVPALFFIRLEGQDFRQVDLRLLKHPAILLSVGTFIIFYVVLSGSVWVFQENNVILSGSNWQDTPMHLEIIESLNQGNFPPQMPYYSGVRMTYHYFVDLHTAIIEKIADMSNPRIIVYLNSLFASLFALIIYMIANYITKSRRSATFAGIIGIFGGGFSYIMFYDALSRYDWNKFSDLFLQNYVLEWGKFFQIVPTFEVLLQSRPQLIGLPGFALSLYFLYRGLVEKDIKKMILAGMITGLLFPFQITAFLSVILISILLIFYSLSQDEFKFWFKGYLSFIIPVLLSLPFMMAVDPTTTSHLSFQIGWWAPDKHPLGLVIFYVGNLGIPFVMSFFFPLVQRKHEFLIYSWLLTMFILPNIVTFTPYSFDMYKFFHFMWIPVAITAGCILGRLWDKKLYVIVMILVIFSVLTPFLDAAWNLSVSYPGYSLNEYRAGIWVRGNTPQDSVFLEDASVHSPPTQIGGRLRIMGYKTWSNGQGYNMSSRISDIEKAFNGTSEELSEMITKYNISYSYIGRDEIKAYPNAKEKFDKYFRSVYSNDNAGIWIYKVNANLVVRKD